MNVTLRYRIKLQHLKSDSFCLYKTVLYQFFSYMQPPLPCIHSITCIAQMAASAYIVGMENIKSHNLAIFYPNACPEETSRLCSTIPMDRSDSQRWASLTDRGTRVS